MQRWAAFLLALGLAWLAWLAWPAWADMYPDASNADLPEARTNLGLGTTNVPQFGGIMLSGGAMTAPALIDTPGSRASWYGKPGKRWQLYIGSDASPLTTGGPAFAISDFRAVPVSGGGCGGAADTGCVSSLLINTTGTSAQEIVTSGITVFATGASTHANSDVQALNAISMVTGSAVGVGMGAYIQGRRDTATGRAMGAEISSFNNTTTDCNALYINIGDCDGIWIASRGLVGGIRRLSAAVHVGAADATSGWREGITFNPTSVLDTTFLDKSTSTSSIVVSGTHTTAIHTDPAAGNVELGGPVVLSAEIKLAVTTVAALPVCNTASRDSLRIASDAAAPAWNATLTGGGAVRVLALCDGTVWRAH